MHQTNAITLLTKHRLQRCIALGGWSPLAKRGAARDVQWNPVAPEHLHSALCLVLHDLLKRTLHVHAQWVS